LLTSWNESAMCKDASARLVQYELAGWTLRRFLVVLTLVAAGVSLPARSQTPSQPATTPDQAAAKQQGSEKKEGKAPGLGNVSGKAAPAEGQTGQDALSGTKHASAGEQSASTMRLSLGPLAPSTPPTDLPKDRPVIGLALGGGGAEALSEIGVLQWFEEHRIPVDVIAGTSMGSIIAALYSTGHTSQQMREIMTEDSVSSVFRIAQAYTAQNFRRREDSRDIPNAVTIGLRHGASFRNSLLTDTGLNELLDKEFLRYNDQMDFNNLPIPFRCKATDLNDARSVTFARGSLQDAVRASASIPGVFRPFELDGHEYVDGAILENLPTPDVKAMNADVILAVSLKLQPVGKGDLDSILGVLQRAFAVGIENDEARDRKLANVVISPDVGGFTENDYLKTALLAQRGYEAAEAQKADLLKYSIDDAQWEQYLAHRGAKQQGPPGNVLRVKVQAPDDDVQAAAQQLFALLVNHPVDTKRVEKLLSELRSDGRYDADYAVGYDKQDPRRPILLITVNDKRTGPPFLLFGLNLAAQSGGVTRATVNTMLLDQDFGGYGSELRTKVDFGFASRFESEYYRKLSVNGFFVAPRVNVTRTPYYIYNQNLRLSERLSQFYGGGADIGWGDGSTQELRAGWQYQNVRWSTTTGSDGLPDYHDNSQTARLQYIYDSQDRALVPQFGVRSVTDVGYLYGTPGSPSTPQIFSQIEFAHTFTKRNIVLMNMEGGTMLNHGVAQPFRYRLGGPLRLSGSAIDQYRGTDYFLFTPGYLRRMRSLPSPLSNSLYLAGVLEAGQMRSPDGPTVTRGDIFFGIVAETPLGIISIGPAIGNGSERKLVFTLGRLF
jgi:NTE family protein